jgi:chromosome segregation ATPase
MATNILQYLLYLFTHSSSSEYSEDRKIQLHQFQLETPAVEEKGLPADLLEKIKKLSDTLTRIRGERDDAILQIQQLRLDVKRLKEDVSMLSVRAERAERHEAKVKRRSERAINELSAKLADALRKIKDWERKYALLSTNTDGALRHQQLIHEQEKARLKERLDDLEHWYALHCNIEEQQSKSTIMMESSSESIEEQTIVPDAEESDSRYSMRHQNSFRDL